MDIVQAIREDGDKGAQMLEDGYKTRLMGIAAATSAALPLAANADPSVTIDSVVQRWPWNNKVDITYTVTGGQTRSAGVYCGLRFAVSVNGVSHNFEGYTLGASAENGTHTITWTAPSGIVSDACSMTATLFSTNVPSGNDYMIVDLNTGARPFALSSLSAVDSFAAHPVTYRAGETVTAITPNDGRVALVATAAPSAGSVSFTPTMDGLWRLENSNGSTVFVGVGWGVFGEAWSYDFNIASLFRMHTQGDGPNRKGLARIFPNVAYSGDHWRRNGAVASTLTFIAPNRRSTTFDLTGTGALWFKFNQSGKMDCAARDGGRHYTRSGNLRLFGFHDQHQMIEY